MSGRSRVGLIHGVVLLVIVVLAGCSSTATATQRGNSVVYLSGSSDPLLPSDTLADWVGYADAVLVVEVHFEAERLDDRTLQGRTGLIRRDLAMSVQATLWMRGARFVAPATLTIVAPGWVRTRESTQPMVEPGCSRLEVGHTYVMALTTTGATPGWSSIGPGGVLPFDAGVAGQGERVGAIPGDPDKGKSTAYLALEGMGVEDIAAALQAAVPDPLAVTYADLRAPERYAKAAAAASSAAASPTS